MANNDRNKMYEGKIIREGTLENYPSFGLNPDVLKIIKLIDVIWTRKNAPLCAFEVESTLRYILDY